MENLLKRISAADNIISMTNIELVRYLKSMRNSVIAENRIENNTDTELWFDIDGKVVSVKPKTIFYL